MECLGLPRTVAQESDTSAIAGLADDPRGAAKKASRKQRVPLCREFYAVPDMKAAANWVAFYAPRRPFSTRWAHAGWRLRGCWQRAALQFLEGLCMCFRNEGSGGEELAKAGLERRVCHGSAGLKICAMKRDKGNGILAMRAEAALRAFDFEPCRREIVLWPKRAA